MSFWLMKTEPDSYSYADLERLGVDKWDGVRNFRALKFMRQMQLDDQIFIYHTGKEKAIVGVAKVAKTAYPDPQEQDARYVLVDVTPCYPLSRPVTLREIKQNASFAEWELVHQPRLSVMPVTYEHWQLVLHLANTK